VLSVALSDYGSASGWSIVLEKVSRTPDDAPIVAAIGFARGGSKNTSVVQFYIAICGLSDRPTRHGPRDLMTLTSKIEDYKGSIEYRTEMGRTLANRALMRAVSESQE
jgi:hypothetical protein